MSSSILHQLIAVPGKDVELGNDIKESPSHAFCLGHIGVQLVFAAQIPGPRKVVCLQQKDGTKTLVCRLCQTSCGIGDTHTADDVHFRVCFSPCLNCSCVAAKMLPQIVQLVPVE